MLGDENSFSLAPRGFVRNEFGTLSPKRLMLDAPERPMFDAYSPLAGKTNNLPGMSATLPASASKLIGKFGLGKAGAFGIPYLGAGIAAYGLAKKLGLFGRKKSGMNPDEAAEMSYANQLAGLQQNAGGELASMGSGLMASGRPMLERGRSGYLNALMDPAVAAQQRAQLLGDMTTAGRANAYRVGLTGGPAAVAQLTRNSAAYNPALAQGLVGIGQNQLARRAQGYQSMAGFGQQDFNQGLGLRTQGIGMQAQGLGGLQGFYGTRVGRNNAMANARRANNTAMLGGLAQGIGTFAGMGKLG